MTTEFKVLGPLEVWHDGVRITVPAGHAEVLLTTLLLRANEVVSTDALVERLWPGGHATEGRPGEAILLDTLATVHRTAGDHDRAIECLERALHLNLSAGDRYSAGINLANLGRLHREVNRLTDAVKALERSLDLSRAVGDRHNQALALAGLGDVHLESGDLATARGCWREALEIFKDLGAPETREIGERLLTHVGTS